MKQYQGGDDHPTNPPQTEGTEIKQEQVNTESDEFVDLSNIRNVSDLN